MINRRFLDLYKNCTIATAVDEDNQVTQWAEYEEEDLHKPLIKSTGGSAGIYLYGNPLYSYDEFTPRKGREWSEMEVPVDYSQFSGLTDGDMPRFVVLSIQSTLGDQSGMSTRVFGWIDEVLPIATKGPKSNTLIRWHVDYWLTITNGMDENYLNPRTSYNVAFAQGRVRRGPAGMARPDPSVPRRWVHSSEFQIKRSGDTKGPWIIVHYTKNVQVANFDPDAPEYYTQFYTAFWGANEPTITSGGVTYDTIPFSYVYGGLLEEYMGLAPSSIIGVYFSPVPPVSETIIGFSSYSPIPGITFGWHNYRVGVATPEEYEITFSSIATDDNQKYIITDPIGTVYATLPWGQEADRIKMSVDVGSSGAWLNLHFKNGLTSDEGEGRRIQLPLISAPVTSNALSDYILSGQQEYDRTMARIQQEQNLKSGIAGLGTSAIGGAIAGTIAAPGLGTIAGAAIGAAGGGIGLAANYFIQGESDKKSQEALYQLMGNQVSNVLIAGGGSNWLDIEGGLWRVVKLVRDSESASELATEQDELGYLTDAYLPDCSTLINAGGPLRIEGLQVRGDVNREGKAYIRALFERGVNIDVIQLTWS